jgi:hypothetical protein
MRIVADPAIDPGRDGAAPSDGLYSDHDNDISKAVREWALANGDNPQLRIALCGYEEEHGAAMPASWDVVAWKTAGGFGSQRESKDYNNRGRERIWFSPHCLRPQALLFPMTGTELEY